MSNPDSKVDVADIGRRRAQIAETIKTIQATTPEWPYARIGGSDIRAYLTDPVGPEDDGFRLQLLGRVLTRKGDARALRDFLNGLNLDD